MLSWNTISYNFVKQFYLYVVQFGSKATSIDEVVIALKSKGYDIDCIICNLAIKYPNFSDLNSMFNDNTAFNLCANNTTAPSVPFDINLTSTWNDTLSAEMKSLLPIIFSGTSSLDLNGVVTKLSQKYPNPFDAINYLANYIVQYTISQPTQSPSQTQPNPPVPQDILDSSTTVSSDSTVSSNKHMIFLIACISVVIIALILILYFLLRKRKSI